MNALLLTLKGGYRSWGGLSVGSDRWTNLIPTASAILGLAGACIGLDAEDVDQVKAWYEGFWISSCTSLEYAQLGERLSPLVISDYQTVCGKFGMSGQNKQIESYRGLVTDGLDVVAIMPCHSKAEKWLEELVFAFEQPRFTPYLGRRSYPLSSPPRFQGEKLVEFCTWGDLANTLVVRLSGNHLNEGRVLRCLWRVPCDLDLEKGVLEEKWLKIGSNRVLDQRSSFYRTFSSRCVCDYVCEISY